MAGKKIIFIIPGFKHQPTQKAYKEVSQLLKKEGYSPVPITITWSKSTISENTEYVLRKIWEKIAKQKSETQKNISVFGFSYGAMIALIASTKIPVKSLMLCSLSPYFKEDLKKIINSPRYKDFETLQCKLLTKKIKAKKVLMFYGMKETKPLIKRVTAAYKQIAVRNKYLLPIKNTEHAIGDKHYLYAIKSATQKYL